MSDRYKSLLEKFQVKDAALQKRLAQLEDAKDASGNPRAPTEAEMAEIKAAETELENLSVSVKAEKAAAERRAEMTRLAAEAEAPQKRDTTGAIAGIQRANTVPAEAARKLTATQKFSVFLKGVVTRHYEPHLDAFAHIKNMGYESLANEWEADLRAQNKTLSTLSGGAGGNAIPTVLASEFIDWLYPHSVFLAGNPQRVDLSAGNLDIVGGNASSTASYRAENANVAYSDASFRKVSLAAKNLAAITAMTNELIRRSPMAIDTFVQNDLRRAFITTMDLALQRGDGSSNTPTGIRNAVGSGQRIAAVNDTAPAAEDVDAELRRMLLLVYASNIPVERLTWQMAPRTHLYLESLRNSDGSKSFPEMSLQNPRLKGFPVLVSTQIPINLGSGTDESEITLTDFAHVLFGDTQEMTLDVSREATYDVSGTLHSAFSKNQTVIRLVGSHDVDVRYDAAVTTLTAVKWGS